MSVESPYAALLDAVPVTEHVVSVLGSETHYWDYGPRDAATTIVVAHGYRGEHHGLEPVIAYLEGVRVIGADLPGFGESGALTEVDHSIAGYAAWLTAFVAALDLAEPPIILGHSFGSIVASDAVSKGLETPKLVLINPIAAPALKGPKAIMTWLTVLFYRTASALPEKAGNALLSNWLVVHFMSVTMARSKDPALRRWIHDQHHTYFSHYSDRDTVVEAFNASISTEVSAVAAQITMPTLLIGADHDPITKVSDLHALEAMIPDAQLVVLPNVGHLIHYELPRETATQIVNFIGTGRVVDSIPQ